MYLSLQQRRKLETDDPVEYPSGLLGPDKRHVDGPWLFKGLEYGVLGYLVVL